MKKALAILLTAIMALSLAACGGASSSSTTSTAASAAGSTASAEGGEILIGCLQDVTGNTSALGISVQTGAQAAVDEINANGGVGGKTLVMKT